MKKTVLILAAVALVFASADAKDKKKKENCLLYCNNKKLTCKLSLNQEFEKFISSKNYY